VNANRLAISFKQAGPVLAGCFENSMVAFGAGVECVVKRCADSSLQTARPYTWSPVTLADSFDPNYDRVQSAR
jgi:hypothetical protein